jgi:hypothetical protein
MDQVGVAMKMRMLMLVWSAIVATTMDTVTGSSMKKPHIHHDDFVFKQLQFTSAMNVHDEEVRRMEGTWRRFCPSEMQ